MKVFEESRYRFVIEVLLIFIMIGTGIIWVASAPLLPVMIEEFGVSRGTVSWTVSIVSIVVAVLALPAGILASKIGIKRTISIGGFLMGAGILTPFSSSFALLLATRFIFAVGCAMSFPIIAGIVSQWFSSRELPLMNGLNAAFNIMGLAVSLLITVPLATMLTWRGTLALYGAVALIIALAWLLLGKDKPIVATGKPQEASSPVSAANVLKLKITWVIALSTVGPLALFQAISTWLPTYYHEVFGMSLAKASSIVALFPFAGISAAVLGGLLPMWTGLRKPFLIIPGLLIGLAAPGAFMVNNEVIIFASTILFGFCVMVYMPSIYTIPMELPGMTAKTIAIVIALAISTGNIGGFLGPLIVGYLADLTGSYLPGLIICSILSLSLLLAGLLLPETGPKAKKKLEIGDA